MVVAESRRYMDSATTRDLTVRIFRVLDSAISLTCICINRAVITLAFLYPRIYYHTVLEFITLLPHEALRISLPAIEAPGVSTATAARVGTHAIIPHGYSIARFIGVSAGRITITGITIKSTEPLAFPGTVFLDQLLVGFSFV